MNTNTSNLNTNITELKILIQQMTESLLQMTIIIDKISAALIVHTQIPNIPRIPVNPCSKHEFPTDFPYKYKYKKKIYSRT